MKKARVEVACVSLSFGFRLSVVAGAVDVARR